MRQSLQRSFTHHARLVWHQFLQGGDSAFAGVLTEQAIAPALADLGGWLDRVFSPLVTLWVFLGQVLSADPSCCAAVARLAAHRAARGQRPCSARTSEYCQARKRLPEAFIAGVARRAGRALDAGADTKWLWKGRRVSRVWQRQVERSVQKRSEVQSCADAASRSGPGFRNYGPRK
jgi:hypothetical protein